MKSMDLFKKQGGFEVSKQRALKNCKSTKVKEFLKKTFTRQD